MRKLHLASLVTMAVLSIFLQCRVEAENQIDMLKNQFLPAELRNISYLIGEVKKKYSEKCKKAAEGVENSTIYQDFENGATELAACITAAANVTAIEEEVEKARTFGDLDTVFNKHCSDGIKCSLDFNEKVQPCRSAKERQQNAVAMRIVTSLGGYMCSMGSSRFARVVEEGLKCLATTHDAIKACFHNSFLDIKMPKLLDFRDFVMEPSLCVEWEHFHSCTLQQLKRCGENTPASVAETVFKIIKNERNCYQDDTVTAPVNEVSLLSLILSSGM